MQRIEYVGNVIDSTGLSYTRKKLDSVYNFVKPQTQKQMKQFLGLANYFRDHIRDHSSVVAPLQALINPKYTRRVGGNPIAWNTIAETAFDSIREAIHQCPKLFFMNDTSPISLQTDASDYGIGAYLFQTVDSKELPIAFISKSLAKSQIKWTTA